MEFLFLDFLYNHSCGFYGGGYSGYKCINYFFINLYV